GYKIREGRLKRDSYLIIIGEKEVVEKSLSIRSSKKGDLGSFFVDDFIIKIKAEIKEKRV
ncbi:MAG: hypothetical protein LBD41_04410, partial [Clostridiales Family XIII bacterium]|nr:hypothetical protein [Clostridiales Family XIII bacterium]